jgi:hypothetical protein
MLDHHLLHLSHLLLVYLLLLSFHLLILLVIIDKLSLFCLNVYNRSLRLVLLLILIVHRLILHIFLLLRNRSLREFNLSLNLHVILFLFFTLSEEIFKLSFK